jgi:hypothetical protein
MCRPWHEYEPMGFKFLTLFRRIIFFAHFLKIAETYFMIFSYKIDFLKKHIFNHKKVPESRGKIVELLFNFLAAFLNCIKH